MPTTDNIPQALPLRALSPELADVLDAILRDLGQVVECEHVRIMLLTSVLRVTNWLQSDRADDADNDLLVTVRDHGPFGSELAPPTDPIRPDRYPLNQRLMREQKPIVISNTAQSDLWIQDGTAAGIRAWIGAPLVVKGESIGVLTLHSSQPQAYTERDAIVVFAFASQAAEAIDKIRLLDQAQGRLQAMMALYDASLDVIGQSQDPDRLLESLVRHAVDLTRAEAGAIYVLQPDRRTLRLIISHGFTDDYLGTSLTVGEGLAGKIVQSGQPIIVSDYREWPGHSEQYSRDPRFSAILGVPLKWEGSVIGVLDIYANCALRTFNDEDRWLAELFANQVAIALSNARLVEQNRRRLDELMALRDVSLQMTSSLNLGHVLDSICANVLKLTDTEDTHIYLYDAVHDQFTNAVALWRSGEHKPAVSQPRKGGLTDQVRRSGQPMVIEDAPHHPLYSSPEALKWGIQSIAGFPLKRAGNVLGVFTVVYIKPHHFTDDELRTLNLLADHAAIAIENARLYADVQQSLIESRQRAQRLELVGRLSALINSSLDPQLVMQQIVDELARIMSVEKVAVVLFDEALDYGRVYAESAPTPNRDEVRVPMTGNPTYEILRDTHRPLMITDVATDPATANVEVRSMLVGRGVRSMLLAPLLVNERLIGSIGLDVIDYPRVFNQAEIDLCQTLANQAAVAIQNARLYEQAQIERERMAALSAEMAARASELAERNLYLQTLGELTAALATELSLGNIMDVVTQRVARVVDSAVAVILLPDAEGTLRIRSSYGLPIRIVEALTIRPDSRSRNWVAYESGQPLIVNDSSDTQARVPERREVLQDAGVDNFLSISLRSRNRSVGLMIVANKAGKAAFTQADVDLLMTFAGQAAAAIENALAYRQLQVALAERERTQQALIRSESLAAVGQLVAGVAHELNNPLATVSSLIQSVLETIGLPYSPSLESSARLPVLRPDKIKLPSLSETIEMSEDLAFSLKEMYRAKGIVSALLDLSRQSWSYTEEVSLTVVCQDALRVLANKLKLLPIDIVESYADGLPTVRGNFANLGQVALNIIQNAVEAFEKAPGKIEIGTRHDAAQAVVSFYVADNGPGISPEVLPNIFHPFFTTKQVGIGTGLGLYISYEIVKKHGGEIVVETQAGHGTTFRVELPRQRQAEGAEIGEEGSGIS